MVNYQCLDLGFLEICSFIILGKSRSSKTLDLILVSLFLRSCMIKN